jgi:peptidoglycan/xylan/chitin deacetylase (PgdA/CDA1 family)
MFKKILMILILLLVVGVVSAQERPPFRVYFTFEDGPTEVYTNEILDILAQYGAKATFLPNGYQIAGHEAILQRVIREGHAIGNHLWEEPGYYFGTDPAKLREAYYRSEDAIRAALGPDLVGVYDAQPKLVRYPGGGGSPFPIIDGLQVITYNWNVDSDDCGWWLDLDPGEFYDADVIDNVLNTPQSSGLRYNAYQYGDGVIIAMHDINRVTSRVLPVILSELQAAGATFEKLPRPWDQPGTMPVSIGVPPQGEGVAGIVLPAYITDYAFVRITPSRYAEVAFTSPAEDVQVMAIGRTEGWIQIVKDGVTGWVYDGGVKISGPISSLPRVQ